MEIFVFGSNEAGRHGRGAAKAALDLHGAIYGQGRGIQGRSYAIPTRDAHIRTLSLYDIQDNVTQFLIYAREHPEHTFYVTRIGCGLAGYDDADIAPFFAGHPPNCDVDPRWKKFL